MSETATQKQFTIVRVFDAPRDVLWRAWTDPEEWPHWMHLTGLTTPRESVSADVRAGGRYGYTMVAPDGTGYPSGGVYREVVEPERLVFTWADPADPDGDAPLITVTLDDLGDGRTQQTFHVLGVDGHAGDDFIYDGWDQVFEELTGHLS